jgi:hypothetical protein
MNEYIISKAERFVTLGPDEYRKGDAFKMPNKEWTKEELEILKHACMQLIGGKGFTKENPLTEVGIPGFYKLIDLFHYNCKRQALCSYDEDGFLDEMTCVHFITQQKLILYNFIPR